MDTNSVENLPFWKKKRTLINILTFLGYVNMYTLRVNLSIAAVSMTTPHTVILSNGTSVQQPAEFDWTSKEKGLVLSSFFYGYACTQLIGGYIATRLGGTLVFGLALFSTAIFSLFSPMAANTDLYVFIALRVVMGAFEGSAFPSLHEITTKWAPLPERSRFMSFALSGINIGTVVAMSASGLLINYYGWPSVFYVFGSIGIVWYAIWLLVVRQSPENDSFIFEEEKRYIKAHQISDNTKSNRKVPWKDIFSSKPVWAIVIANFAEMWGHFTLLTYLPSFLNDVHHFDIKSNGFLSALPYIAMAFTLNVGGFLADWLQNKSYLTCTQVRKYFNCIAFIMQGIFLSVSTNVADPAASTACLVIAIGFGGLAMCGFYVNHLDIAPNYASVLLGFSNTFGATAGIIAPLVAGIILQNKSVEEWRTVFYITTAIYLIGAFFYWIWAVGVKQPWASEPSIPMSSIQKEMLAYTNPSLVIEKEETKNI